LGHTFSPFLNFKGGKGVATSAGVLLFLDPLITGGALFIFLVAVTLTKYVSFGSIMAVLFLIGTTILKFERTSSDVWRLPLFGQSGTNVWRLPYDMSGNLFYLVFVIFLGVFVIYKHSSNIARLIRGTENKISFKS
jgi:glycerol-3-phosphate acyltransferase PlsY